MQLCYLVFKLVSLVKLKEINGFQLSLSRFEDIIINVKIREKNLKKIRALIANFRSYIKL